MEWIWYVAGAWGIFALGFYFGLWSVLSSKRDPYEDEEE